MILLLYGFCRWLRCVQRGATSLAYWGIFSVACNAARTNSLISYGIFRWQISVSLQAFAFYIFSPRFFGGLHHPPCGLDLLLLLYRLYRFGQGLTAQVVVQVFVSVIVVGEVPDTVRQTLLPVPNTHSVLLRHCQADSVCAHTRAARLWLSIHWKRN